MSFTVELPDSVAEALRLAPPDAEAEVRKELALALYARRHFSGSERPGSFVD